jgi:hypothetical protein
MRRLLLLPFLLTGVAAAGDAFEERLRAFDEARPFALEPGGQARVNPAVEALVATGDIRAVGPLATYLLEAITAERRLKEGAHKTQQELADALARVETLTADLKRLELKEKAGDRTVGPAIEKRADERARREREFERLQKKLERIDRTITFLRELRERLADGCATVLKGLAGERVDAGVAGLRRSLDVADREQALFLVRILAASGLPHAEEQLLEILTHPKADEAVRRRAQYALAAHLSRRGAEALLLLWEREPDALGEHARHVLSLAARRRLESVVEARAWVATLP